MVRILPRLAVIVILAACTPSVGYSDDLAWQPLVTTSETLNAVNLIKGSDKQIFPCNSQTASGPNETTPPAVRKFATLSLDDSAVSVAWSPDGKYLATGEGLGAHVIKIWSFPELKLLHVIKKYDGWGGNQIEFTHDSKFLITTSVIGYNGNGRNATSYKPTANAFSLIDVATGTVSREIAGYADPPRYPLANGSHEFEFTPDGTLFFTVFNGDLFHTYVYSAVTWKIVSVLPVGFVPMTPGPGPSQVSFLDLFFGQGLVNRKPVASFLIWDGERRKFIYDAENIVNSEHFDTGAIMADQQTCIIGLAANNVFKKVINPSVNQSPSQQIYHPDDAIKILLLTNNETINVPATPSISRISYNSLFQLLAYADSTNQMSIIFTQRNKPVKAVATPAFRYDVMDIQFNPNGKFLALAGDSLIQIYAIGG